MKTSSGLRPLFGAYLLVLSAAAASQNAVTTHTVRVYAGPDDSYPMVARLDADVPVQVMGCLDDWSWCDVAFEGNRGWLYAPDLAYDYDGDSVPLYTYAPSLGIPVVQFTVGEYWDRYYYGRPWYAQREEWEHRGTSGHHRPSGPPPSAGPPPHSARADRPVHEYRLSRQDRASRENGLSHEDRPSREAEPERRLRLGSAEPPHRDAERHEGARDSGAARPPPDGRSPDLRSAPSSPRAEGARHEDGRHGEKPGDRAREDRPSDTPH